jgi:hypothetical protein
MFHVKLIIPKRRVKLKKNKSFEHIPLWKIRCFFLGVKSGVVGISRVFVSVLGWLSKLGN